MTKRNEAGRPIPQLRTLEEVAEMITSTTPKHPHRLFCPRCFSYSAVVNTETWALECQRCDK